MVGSLPDAPGVALADNGFIVALAGAAASRRFAGASTTPCGYRARSRRSAPDDGNQPALPLYADHRQARENVVGSSKNQFRS